MFMWGKKKTSPNFKKPIDKSAVLWYNIGVPKGTERKL